MFSITTLYKHGALSLGLNQPSSLSSHGGFPVLGPSWWPFSRPSPVCPHLFCVAGTKTAAAKTKELGLLLGCPQGAVGDAVGAVLGTGWVPTGFGRHGPAYTHCWPPGAW